MESAVLDNAGLGMRTRESERSAYVFPRSRFGLDSSSLFDKWMVSSVAAGNHFSGAYHQTASCHWRCQQHCCPAPNMRLSQRAACRQTDYKSAFWLKSTRRRVQENIGRCAGDSSGGCRSCPDILVMGARPAYHEAVDRIYPKFPSTRRKIRCVPGHKPLPATRRNSVSALGCLR